MLDHFAANSSNPILESLAPFDELRKELPDGGCHQIVPG
jgi:hypothetical protein